METAPVSSRARVNEKKRKTQQERKKSRIVDRTLVRLSRPGYRNRTNNAPTPLLAVSQRRLPTWKGDQGAWHNIIQLFRNAALPPPVLVSKAERLLPISGALMHVIAMPRKAKLPNANM